MLTASLYNNIRRCASTKAISRAIDISPEIRSALDSDKPVVALESTIITHGMPHPHNLETALSVESIIRDQGAVPATIGILNGRIKIGLEKKELELLSKPSAGAVKTSRRDFPYVLSHNLNGGTTVSGTLMIASHVGIKVFVTGGVGGVHRHGESTLDISADLVEMGRQPIMVVSSGIKSILDIERTLEYLETQGVCVMSYGPSKHFPAFYCEKSGFMAPYHVTKPEEAARVLFQSNELGIGSGILMAVPIPKPFSIDREIMDTSISLALEEAENAGVHGKEITPFVLERVGQITAGKSLESNIALIKNNAQVGSQVAVEYQKLAALKSRVVFGSGKTNKGDDKVVVVGGAVLDCVMTIQTDYKADGRTLPGRISQTPGGVGRNIADSLGKLRASVGSAGSSTSFISALGKDQFGEFLMESVKHLNTRGIRILDHARTACYCALIDKKGDAKVGVGDMEIHSHISPSQIVDNRSALTESNFIVLDGNVPGETIDTVLAISIDNKIPVWFEPTDVLKAPKPFKTNLWTSIACSSPNMNELKEMACAAGVRMNEELILEDVNGLLKQLVYLGQPLAAHIPILMITMGKLGILMLSHCKSDEPPRDSLIGKEQPEICARYYPTVPLSNVTNSLGAGDSAAAGFIDGLLRGLTEPECVALGHLASREALQSAMAVPREFKSYDRISQTKATYHEIPLS